jgi:hypothetical protein
VKKYRRAKRANPAAKGRSSKKFIALKKFIVAQKAQCATTIFGGGTEISDSQAV